MHRLQRNHDHDPAAPFDHAGEESAAGANGWERPSVTFRLTQERRRALLALTPELGMRASPTAALDFAIERAAGLGAARNAQSEDEERGAAIEELREILGACAALRANSDEALASLDRIESRLAELDGEAEESAPSDMPMGEWGPAPTLGAWLSREAGHELAWVVVKARWLGAAPADRGQAILRVDAWAAAPAAFAGQTASLETVQIGPLRLGALAAFENDAVGVLVCSRGAQGWIARLHAIDAKGKLGPELDSFNA